MRTIEISPTAGIFYILILILAQCQTGNKIDYRVIRVNNGWGYELYSSEKILIHQEIIPVIEGNNPFLSRGDARKTARLALHKLYTGKIPLITRRDLDSLGVAYP